MPYVERGVAKKIVHPKYNFFTYEYDLALVQLDKPLEFAPHISPICLPASDDLLIGENATVTGWGRLSEGGTLPSVLQEVKKTDFVLLFFISLFSFVAFFFFLLNLYITLLLFNFLGNIFYFSAISPLSTYLTNSVLYFCCFPFLEEIFPIIFIFISRKKKVLPVI